jgi:hypothetical protein
MMLSAVIMASRSLSLKELNVIPPANFPLFSYLTFIEIGVCAQGNPSVNFFYILQKMKFSSGTSFLGDLNEVWHRNLQHAERFS